MAQSIIDDTGEAENEHINDIQQAGVEVKEMLQQVIACNLTNTIHIAKLTRLGDAHKAKAKAYNAKANIVNPTKVINGVALRTWNDTTTDQRPGCVRAIRPSMPNQSHPSATHAGHRGAIQRQHASLHTAKCAQTM